MLPSPDAQGGPVERRTAMFALALLGAAPLDVLGQQPGKVPVIGLLGNDSVKPSPNSGALLNALRERGLESGRNLRVDDRIVLEGYAPMGESAAALVRANVDLIVAYGATATTAAVKATRTIPIVTVMGSDPVASGMAVSLARPGGNVTGISTLVAGLTGKEFELLQALVPGLARVGYLLAGGSARYALNIQDAEIAAKSLALELQVAEVRSPGDIESAVAGLAKGRVGAVHVAGSTLLAAHSERVVSAIARHRLPAAYTVERYIEVGGLMVYGPSTRKAFAKAAIYVERILRGEKPEGLPIEQMRDLELAVNLKTARALGIKVPQTILLRADRVVE